MTSMVVYIEYLYSDNEQHPVKRKKKKAIKDIKEENKGNELFPSFKMRTIKWQKMADDKLIYQVVGYV